MALLIGAILIATLIQIISNSRSKRKRDKNIFGENPHNYNEKFDMSLIEDYYKARRENLEEVEGVDDLTWNDLDLDQFFKRINYSSTTLGETYLYSKLRELNYDKKRWSYLEKVISFFKNNEKDRSKIKGELNSVGKIKNDKIINFIFNPKIITIKNFYIYALLSLGFILSLVILGFNKNLGLGILIVIAIINILANTALMNYMEEEFEIISYVARNINLVQKILKINSEELKGFNEEIKNTIDNFKDIKKINFYKSILSDKNDFSDLGFILDYIKMLFMLNIISYQMIAKTLEKNKENFLKIYDIVGELEFALNLCYYRESLEDYIHPTFIEEDIYEIEEIYHPLLENPIKNSIKIDNSIIFTGSNASGKSTFIKTLGINQIMAQSLNTVLAKKYNIKLSKVVTSMAVKDNIIEGDSYFMAEIKSLKRLITSLDKDIPVLALIDEILKGTNTIERIAASSAILEHGIKTNSKILVATHDLELTEIFEDIYDNYHFTETVTDEDIIFDYKLKHGPSKTKNAIKLLKVMNFDEEIVKNANENYKEFLNIKKWTKKKLAN